MRIWVDVENLPDVLFFAPILRGLEARRHRIFITARREEGLRELCNRKGWLISRTVGHHSSRGRPFKIAAGMVRAAALFGVASRFKADLLVNFASRPAILAAAALRIPVFTFFDYEHVSLPMVGRISRTVCLPAAIAGETLTRLGIPERKVLRLPATKEEVYAHDFAPTPLRGALGVPDEAPLVLIRSPARAAHYHDARSERIYEALLERIEREPDVHARVLCRSPEEGRRLDRRFAGNERVRRLDPTGDGLNLIWNADLVASGGGTMTREAAALGVPAYSLFTGPEGAVDRALFESGKVIPVRELAGVRTIRFGRHERSGSPPPAERRDLLDLLLRGIEEAGR